jgi:addiction module HigA family antidote
MKTTSTLRSNKRRPTHPGAILREDVLSELQLSQTALAKRLGVSRGTISQIVNEQRPITPDMALRLSRFLGTTPSSWLAMQQAVDIWDTEHLKEANYKWIKPLKDSEFQLAI